MARLQFIRQSVEDHTSSWPATGNRCSAELECGRKEKASSCRLMSQTLIRSRHGPVSQYAKSPLIPEILRARGRSKHRRHLRKNWGSQPAKARLTFHGDRNYSPILFPWSVYCRALTQRIVSRAATLFPLLPVRSEWLTGHCNPEPTHRGCFSPVRGVSKGFGRPTSSVHG